MIRGGRKSEDRGGRKSEDRGGRKSESSDRGSTSGGSLLQKGAMLFRKAGRSSGEIKDR
ncbi:hypothetical protein M427DRAFT_61304 [Gonapodya prolifera JEL478]|uniref:Uncharacterized protein n=1 Tax=Gonapodya prolifera (strain JEL478) TaxID=1344416 RepID=A0A139A2C8_GONPJ|nr:hypothetical protein M427DRAFT_61304 [Gonapodya prolifera JEL478]|eukprot:KXS10937.1 hypothetical protein M427DRAFT_61304 [Gonapodya prolifera JEL478]